MRLQAERKWSRQEPLAESWSPSTRILCNAVWQIRAILERAIFFLGETGFCATHDPRAPAQFAIGDQHLLASAEVQASFRTESCLCAPGARNREVRPLYMRRAYRAGFVAAWTLEELYDKAMAGK